MNEIRIKLILFQKSRPWYLKTVLHITDPDCRNDFSLIWYHKIITLKYDRLELELEWESIKKNWTECKLELEFIFKL